MRETFRPRYGNILADDRCKPTTMMVAVFSPRASAVDDSRWRFDSFGRQVIPSQLTPFFQQFDVDTELHSLLNENGVSIRPMVGGGSSESFSRGQANRHCDLYWHQDQLSSGRSDISSPIEWSVN